jgi:hypothetical protein
MVKWLERPTLIFNARGSNPGLVIGIFLQYFIISSSLWHHQDPYLAKALSIIISIDD